VYITKWLHNALRQVASTQKRLATGILDQDREVRATSNISTIQEVSRKVWQTENDDVASMPPAVVLSSTGTKPTEIEDAYVFNRSAIVPVSSHRNTAKASTRATILEEKVKAIAQVLASFGLLDDIAKPKQERLLKAIYEILDAPEE